MADDLRYKTGGHLAYSPTNDGHLVYDCPNPCCCTTVTIVVSGCNRPANGTYTFTAPASTPCIWTPGSNPTGSSLGGNGTVGFLFSCGTPNCFTGTWAGCPPTTPSSGTMTKTGGSCTGCTVTISCSSP